MLSKTNGMDNKSVKIIPLLCFTPQRGFVGDNQSSIPSYSGFLGYCLTCVCDTLPQKHTFWANGTSIYCVSRSGPKSQQDLICWQQIYAERDIMKSSLDDGDLKISSVSFFLRNLKGQCTYSTNHRKSLYCERAAPRLQHRTPVCGKSLEDLFYVPCFEIIPMKAPVNCSITSLRESPARAHILLKAHLCLLLLPCHHQDVWTTIKMLTLTHEAVLQTLKSNKRD